MAGKEECHNYELLLKNMLVLILIQVKIICNVHGICSCETAEFTEREMIPPLEPPILESAFLENGEIFIPNHMSRKA
jgi:hypothetical protein